MTKNRDGFCAEKLLHIRQKLGNLPNQTGNKVPHQGPYPSAITVIIMVTRLHYRGHRGQFGLRLIASLFVVNEPEIYIMLQNSLVTDKESFSYLYLKCYTVKLLIEASQVQIRTN